MDGNHQVDAIFAHGSAWVRADFHLHTRTDDKFSYAGEDDRFVADYVEKLKEQNIRLGVITNHNKFDLEEFKALRKKAKKEDIYLLPGVELSVNDGANGIHTLVVFHEAWIDSGANYIQPFISAAFVGQNPVEYEKENHRSSYSLLQIIELLENFQKDFFLVFAHVEDKNGLWRELNGGRIAELGQKESFKQSVLAFQKVRTNGPAEQGRPCRTKVKSWLQGWYPAEVEGSDCKSIADIGKGKPCYIKLGDFSFYALKYALKDYPHHVSTEMPEYHHSYIKSISFEGGKLDGRTINFSPELNTLIGIRGSGKSSVLEALRYGLGIAFGDKALDREYKEKLVAHTYGSGGKVVIRAVDRRGIEYEIRRIWNEKPDVYVNDTLRPGISIRETVINKPIYFGQKDLSSSGEGFEKDLVEKLLGEQLAPIRLKIEEQKQKVKMAAEQLKNLANIEEKIEEYTAKKQDAEFKLSIFKKHGVEERLQKQIDFDADTRFFQQTEEKARQFLQELEDISNRHEDELKNQQFYQSKQNDDFLAEYLKQYKELIVIFEQIKENLARGKAVLGSLQNKSSEFDRLKASLKEEFARVERQLAEELNTSGAAAIRPAEYRQLSKTVEQAKSMLDMLEKQKLQDRQRKEQLLAELAALNELWHQEYQAITKILHTVNARHSALKITAEYKSDKNAFLQFLKSMVKGSGIREARLQLLTEKYADFGAMYQDMPQVLAEIGSGAAAFEEIFVQNLGDFLTWQVPNGYRIEYHEKELKHHSLGQRASALILFVLSQEDNDVYIIDQPEDDLDNQTIYEDVIKLLRQLKHKTQFIFATHNANFPVLGDAEQVLVCRSEKDIISVETGSIDVPFIQEKVVAIMEGGKRAFHRRKEIYDLWMRQSC